MKRVMRKTSDCILIAVLCFAMVIAFFTPVAYADTVSDLVLMRVTSENQDEYVQAVGTQLATTVNPAYGYLFSTIDDYLEIKDMSQSMIYDPATDEGGIALVDENADVGYALAEDGTLVRIDNFYGRAGGGGRSRVDSAEDVKISAFTFSEMAQMYNDHYGPKTTKEYISWRTDPRYADVADSLVAPRLSFFTDGYFFGETDWQEVYLVPWYTDGTTDYFSMYQFHFYYETTKDDSGTRTMTLYCDVWDMLNGGDVQTLTITNQLMDIRYIDFSLPTYESRLLFTPYSSYTQYIQKPYYSSWTFDHALTDNIGHKMMYSPDLSTSINIGVYLSCWQSAVTTHDEGTCTFGAGHDTGYYCSDKQIYMDFDFIDTTKLTEDDVITLSGDTFYDYTITNSTTGDSTTVYNYITNNYNYPVSEDSGSSGEEDSGSSSGNVLVSGAIDVGGQVDVNVNIEQSSSGSSSDFLVPVDDYAEYLPEVAPEVSEYLETTYSFLPPEIVGLLIGGIGAAVLCRILGR